MLLFFDTEFTGLHKNATLISLGIVAENGKTFYAEFNDFDRSQVNEWIRENVINHLKFKDDIDYQHIVTVPYPIDAVQFEMVGDKDSVKKYLTEWLSQFNEPLQLVSDVCHYDMVLFVDIFGDAFSLPGVLSPTCHDINQDIARYYGVSDKDAFNISREDIVDVEIDGKKHNALYDAKVIKACYEKIIAEE